jgi:hypothetical protein
MKTVSLAEAKRKLPETVARRDEPIGSLKVRAVMRAPVTEQGHHDACRALIQMAKKTRTVKTKAKGITAEVRRLRDLGELS